MVGARTLVGLAAALATCSAWAAPEGNLIRNPGFEEGGSPPTAWFADPGLAPKGSVTLQASPFRLGKLALRLAPTAANDDTNKPLAIGQAIPAERFRGKRLYLAGSLQAVGGATAVAAVFAIAGSGAIAASASIMRGAGTQGPARLEDVFQVPDAAGAEQLIFLCAVNGTSGAALFDDLVLSPDVPERFATAQADPGPPLPVKVVVDAGKALRTIPRTLYGINTEWTWNGNGLWDEAAGRLDPSLVRLTRDLGATQIRFPGGTFSDYYHWRDGLGPQAARPWQPGLPGESKSRHVLGTDEMLDFAGRTGSRMLFTANVGTGTAAEAADWVRYVRAKRERPEGVDWWEIGNEVYVNDGSPASNPITMDPAKYAAKCAEFAVAMRRADPAIRIGAISDQNYWFQGYKAWDQTVLAAVAPRIDFVAVHNAYAPMVISDGGRSVRDVYRSLLAAPELVRRNLAKLSAEIGALKPADARRIKIAVTEWGTLYHVQPSSRFVDHCKTLGSALYTAAVMKAFIDTPRVEAAHYFKLVDQLFIGAVGKRGDAFAPTASYYALQLFTRHFGATQVACRTTSPTYDSRANGWVPAVRGVPLFETLCSMSADRRTLYIMAINKHFDRGMEASMALRGFRAGGSATAWTLNGTGIDANTGTAPKQVPGITWAKQAEDEVNPRFAHGGPGEVTLTSKRVRLAGSALQYTFPAHSVTVLEVRR